MLLRNSFMTNDDGGFDISITDDGDETLEATLEDDSTIDVGEISRDIIPDEPSNPDPDVEPEQYPNTDGDINMPSDSYYATMELLDGYSEMTVVDSRSISTVYPVEKEFPRCPVYIRRSTENKLVVTAYITGPIEENAQYLTLLEVLEYVNEGDEVYIFIDSPGGMVSTGAVIASAIDSCQGKVTGIARGFCASAASLIWSACHVCIASPLSVFLYHMSSHFDMGNSESIRERAVILIEYVKQSLLQVALEKGHITRDEFITISKGKEDVIIPAPIMARRIAHPRDEDRKGEYENFSSQEGGTE